MLTALSEVENALIACRRTTERLATLEKATAAAREAAGLAHQSYEAGEIDILTVLDSQRTLLGLEEQPVQHPHRPDDLLHPALQGARRRLVGRFVISFSTLHPIP